MSSNEYVLFKLDDEHYGINIRNVETIEKIMAITRVPYTPNFIKGVVNLRGNVVPVIDLRIRFDLDKRDYDEDTRIIIVKLDEITIGLIADSSSEVIQLDDKDIDESPALRNKDDDNYVKCIGKKNNQIIMIIDIDRILGIVDNNFEII